jgi:hypothetical protein
MAHRVRRRLPDLGGLDLLRRLFYQFEIDYEAQVHVYRVLVFVLPIVAFIATKAICDELRRTQAAPLQGGPSTTVRRRDDGGFEAL